MKALIILGAIVGFVLGAGFGLMAGSPWPADLWRACVAALVAAFLTRWWSGVWMRGLKESFQQHRQPSHFSTSVPAKTTAKA